MATKTQPSNRTSLLADLMKPKDKEKESSKTKRLSKIFRSKHNDVSPSRSPPNLRNGVSQPKAASPAPPVQKPVVSINTRENQAQIPDTSKKEPNSRRISLLRLKPKPKPKLHPQSQSIISKPPRAQHDRAIDPSLHSLLPNYPDAASYLTTSPLPLTAPFNPTPSLLWAATNGHVSVINFLISEYHTRLNADPNAEFMKMDALAAASQNGHVSCIKALLNRHFVSAGRKYCYFKTDPLLEVVRAGGNEACVRETLEAGGNVRAVCHGGRTALHVAAECGNEDAVRLLLEFGAIINAVDSKRETALHLAVKRGDVRVVKILLDCGVDVEVKSLLDSTALHLAAQQNAPAIVSLLLNHNLAININPCDDLQRTPLDYAYAHRDGDEVAALLVSSGAWTSRSRDEKLKFVKGQGNGFEIFGNAMGERDFRWDPERGLQAIKRRTGDGKHKTKFEYEPGYIDESYEY
jgi:ankyrin repeat protein